MYTYLKYCQLWRRLRRSISRWGEKMFLAVAKLDLTESGRTRAEAAPRSTLISGKTGPERKSGLDNTPRCHHPGAYLTLSEVTTVSLGTGLIQRHVYNTGN